MLYLLALLLAALPSALGLVRPDGVGKLPALGWNSWNAYGCNVDEQTVLEAAQKMVDLGLKDAGYEYVNIDDCWSVKSGRDNNTGRLVPDPNKFPDGIDGLATKVHNLGLKLGIYSAAGTQTCAGYPASLGHEELDAQTFADWGIDYLKYDNCNIPADQQDTCQFCNPDGSNGPNGTCTGSGYCPSGYDYSQSNTAKRFNTMRDALEKQSRTILYSLCEWGTADVNTWGNGTGNSWRSTGDINRNWDRIMAILNANSFYMNYVDFWGRPDPDMLEIGTNQAGKTGLSDTEQRSHFALWAAMKSPLITGSYFSNISDSSISLLKNKYLLAFNQDDTYGKPAMPYKWGTNPDWTFDNAHPAEYWSGVSKAGTLVLAINTNSSSQTKNIRFNEIPSLKGGYSYEVTNVWSGSSVGCVSGGFDVVVESHDTAVYLVTGACSGKRDGFISKYFAA